MEFIKEKLAVKPTLKKKEDVVVKIAYIDERKKYPKFDIQAVKNNLQDVLVIKNPDFVVSTTSAISSAPAPSLVPVIAPTPRAKPIQKKIQIQAETEEPAETKTETKTETKVVEPKKKTRKTEKVKKGIVHLEPEDWVEVSRSMIPQVKPNYKIKMDSYFMNNREKFVNFVNTMFDPYRKEFLEEIKNASVTCDTIGSSSGSFELLTHQKLVNDYMNLYTPYRGLLLYFSLGSGKCHKIDTPIMMYDGSIKMVQDICEGELLMGDDSTPRKVLSLARGRDKMYDIVPVKGEKYNVNQEHILCLKASGFPKIYLNKKTNTYSIQWVQNNNFNSKSFTFNEEKQNEVEIKNKAYDFFDSVKKIENVMEISVKDYLNLPVCKQELLKGYKVPVDFSEKELPFDPYIIGYWIGDGTSRKQENQNYRDQCDSLIWIRDPPDNILRSLNLVLEPSGEGGVTGAPPVNKHIPMIYKCNSRENRLKLLAGLIDSDGNLSDNEFEFTQKNEKVIDDVIYLARSLGFSCYKSIKKTSWTYKGIKNFGSAFRICINGEGIDTIPTKIPRKQANPKKQIKDVLVSGIQVKYTGEDDYYGFTIDQNSRYVMGDFSVSHNSCTSIAIAEGMKNNKKVIIMTPASLEDNYVSELKKCGDAMYKKNQYWTFLSDPASFETLSSVLNLSMEYIQKNNGAWIVDITKPTNYDTLSAEEKQTLDLQINEQIGSKYQFIHYNGLRRNALKKMTDNFETNIFDNAVIIIDEAHNFISRIVNKIGKEKEILANKKGQKEKMPMSISLLLYEMLMSAKNARIVFLTGTPIINYPNEIGILFNILRGYIKTWEIPLDTKEGQKIDKAFILNLFAREKTMDYLDYNASTKKLTITRNPFGFENVRNRKTQEYEGVSLQSTRNEMQDDNVFESHVFRILREANIDVSKQEGVTLYLNKALPDKLDDFVNRFIEPSTGKVKNVELFKKRIIGLTSYYRSAQEKLLPRYEKLSDYHVIKIPMSDYQFSVYEAARKEERKMEKSSKGKKGKVDGNGIFKEPTSTYRIFSRLYCNFVMPTPPGRPLPRETTEVSAKGALEKIYGDALKEAEKEDMDAIVDETSRGQGTNADADLDTGADIVFDEALEGDVVIEKNADKSYLDRLKAAIQYITEPEHAATIFSPEGLEIYSPKYLHIIENIKDPEHVGLHLVYSQFRTLEGIGLFQYVLEYNGFTQFKIKKNTSSGLWELNISKENKGKPTFALYTGTETKEEKEIVRNIYNGDWNDLKNVDPSLLATLREMANNNNMGEIIKVFMITSSGSEGINLRNTRYVHIMEPYWHPIRSEQVIGRARRICSHKNLSEELQSVEVFVYLMTFSESQIKSDLSIELKLKDISKKEYYGKKIPLTSDEALYEISTIKEEINSSLMMAIKEASIDCAIYSLPGSKERLQCLQFGQPNSTTFSYKPSYEKEEVDTITAVNKQVLEWRGREVMIKTKRYIYRELNKELGTGELYDYDTYQDALVDANIQPLLIGTIERNNQGKQMVKLVR